MGNVFSVFIIMYGLEAVWVFIKHFYYLHTTELQSRFFCNHSTIKSQNWEGKKKKLAISWPKFSIASNLKTFLYSRNHQKQTPGSVLHKKAVLKKISKTTEKWLCEAFSSRVTGFLVKILSEQTSEVYPEPCQISKLELFVKKINGFQLLTIFMKRSVLDVYQASGYVSGHSIERLWMVVSRTSTYE